MPFVVPGGLTTYVPPPFQRFFGFAPDPNSAQGGSNLETVKTDPTNFAGGVIPDVASYAWPVTAAGPPSWAPGRISRSNEVTSQRAAQPDVPFKVSPEIPWTIDAYRYVLERALKYVMGAETVTGSGPYVHALTPVGLGVTQLPSALVQWVADSINYKASGVVLESVDLTFPFDGTGSLQVEAHPLYMQLVGTPEPTGVILEPAALPMVVRDAQVVFDSGASAVVGITQFRFGFKNNASYDRQVAGHCIDTNTVGVVPISRQLWFPHYHKISARQTVTFELDFLDTQQAQEVAAEWGQIQKIVVTIGEPNTANQIMFTLYATELGSGGVSALTATGDQTSSFAGNAFYSASDGTDVAVTITNATAGLIS